jgi:hypothetical protein
MLPMLPADVGKELISVTCSHPRWRCGLSL